MLEPDVTIAAGVVVGADTAIGQGSIIGEDVIIGDGVQIGRNCTIGNGAQIFHALIGNEVEIGDNSHLGGFGNKGAGTDRIDQSVEIEGRVVIQDRVVIGPQCFIGRDQESDTLIGEGSRIGSHSSIGGAVRTGRFCSINPKSVIDAGVLIPDGCNVK